MSRLIISTTPPLEEDIRIHSFSDSSICGKHAASNRVTGGDLAEFEEFPWLAGLEYVSNYDHENKGIRCGGSLLNERYVLTAAHCIIHHELVLVKVWLGATNISSDGKNCLNVTGDNHCVDSIQKFNAKKTFPHPFYMRRDNINDIGLIELEHSVKFNSFVRPICLRKDNLFPFRIQSYLTVCGWGATENSTSSDIKLKAELPIQNNNACNQLWPWGDSKVNSEQLCVGGEMGKDSCQGDSGGPLMKKYKNAIGDIQWVQDVVFAVGLLFTLTLPYVDWIVNNISGKRDLCTTHTLKRASCVPASQCKVIVASIQTNNSQAIESVDHSQCNDRSDYDLKPPVCCESLDARILSHFATKTIPDRIICGFEKDEYRTLGGEVTEIGEFPWMAALEYKYKLTNQSVGIRCGGTLINNRYVLTAAHCILDREFKLTKVWLGAWKISNTDVVQKLYIKDEIPHPLYSRRSGDNDIGLIRLEYDITYTDFIRPICLPPPYLPIPAVGSTLTVADWGISENETHLQMKMAAPILSNSDCKSKVTTGYINPNQLCVGGYPGKDSCLGDSGRPLMRTYKEKVKRHTQWYQEGVASFAVNCSQSNYPIIYTRVSRYINWIINSIQSD